jgi:ribonuclease J
MYKLLNPTYVIPVHGEPVMLKGHAELAKAEGYQPLQLKAAHKLVLAEPAREAKPDQAEAKEGKDAKDSKPKAFRPYLTQKTYPHGFNYIDGLNILENDPLILKERKKLGYEGLVVAAVAIRTTTGEMVSEVSLSTRGLLDEVLQADIMKSAVNKTGQALDAVFQNGHIDDRTRAAEVISQTLRRHFKHERGKQPTTVVQFVEV